MVISFGCHLGGTFGRKAGADFEDVRISLQKWCVLKEGLVDCDLCHLLSVDNTWLSYLGINWVVHLGVKWVLILKMSGYLSRNGQHYRKVS